MEAPATCAVCGCAASTGPLAPYRDIARAYGWPHEYAHLGCARYKVATRTWTVFSTGERYHYEEKEPGPFECVFEALK